MWMLSFIPDSWLHFIVLALIFVGVVLYCAGFVLRFVPPLIPYKEPIRILSIVLMVAGVYFYGGYGVEMDWRKKAEEAQAKIDVAEQKSNEANAALEAERKKKQKVITEYAVTIKERIVEKEKLINAGCVVAPEAISILNEAATSPLGVKK
ncbi:hypothetical protein UFOVP71_277 [uncultured Caudovirales phage]|uniref:Uncharacterized protein n=1 Tax=uncultured Caudovirales phage TaxID=2100421 RepID=A0A6J5TBR8_9CAUD|nr:hypothetical protein UFOVP71_277 [uncultured Caudovirales phage]